jgi:hypothetical protein
MAYVIDKMFIGHFEMGGTLFDFDPRANKEQIRATFEKGKSVAADIMESRRKSSEAAAEASSQAAATTS